ncbi:hypothetical protein KVR01_009036 [Diaporthe batatas]|uniref:uncharacterized protein n=1 Tax=Diaporthe batatas TaxID=748121 RepID=UPI001D037E76|nr:uncharacterized protein KVR01_009036 [Diaporthe batatas]KAG8160772.1 hypothetical protein KVR01_009036 [Diaporthe batatas]
MKVFIVFAHPEPQSLNGSLLQAAVEELEAQSHEVQISDLYAMHWKSHIDRSDFTQLTPETRLRVGYASREATLSGTLTDDIRREQEKLMWADILILQFPLWWYSMPAIMKGWVDRVYSAGFAYGIGEHNNERWGDRYGEGKMLGKKAMVVVTVGGWKEHFSPRGVCGPIHDLLFPITHGMLYYTGFEVLPSFVVYQSNRVDEVLFNATAEELRKRMRELSSTQPIPFRPQNGGEYEIPSLTLKPEVEVNSQLSGFSIHSRPSKDI